MSTSDTVKAEYAQGSVTLGVCLKRALFWAEFRKGKLEDETAQFPMIHAVHDNSLEHYGIKIGAADFEFRRAIYENMIKTLHDRIRQLDEDQAAYTRGIGRG